MRRRLAILAAIIIAGALLRWALIGRQSFWYDEAVSAELAAAPAWDLALGRARDLGNPPLYPLLLKAWSALAGPSDAAQRGLSAASGVAAIPLFYLLVRRLGGQRASLIAAALLALSPVHVYFAQEARAFALVTLLVVASFLLLLRAIDEPERPTRWALYAVCIFLSIYTHYFAFFAVLAQVIHVFAGHGREPVVRRRFIIALVGAAIAYGVWLPAFFAQLGAPGNLGRSAETWRWHVAGTPVFFTVGSTLVWKESLSVLRLTVAAAGVIGLGAAAIAGVAALRRDAPSLRLALLWLLTPILVPLIISIALFPLYCVRYALLASPALYLLAAVGLDRLGRAGSSACVAACWPAAAASLYCYYTLPCKDAWRDAARELQSRASPGDVIAFDADIGELPFSRYAPPGGRRVRLVPPASPEAAAAGRLLGTGPERGAPRDMTPVFLAAERVWLVRSGAESAGSRGYYASLLGQSRRDVETRYLRGIEIHLYER